MKSSSICISGQDRSVLSLFGQRFRQPAAKILVIKVFVDSPAGMADGGKIALIDKDAGMQWPLAAPPWPTWVGHTAIPVKDAVPIYHLHLGDSLGHPQIFLRNLGQGHAQKVDQALNVAFVKGDGGFAMTAITASFAFEYIFQITAPLADENPLKELVRPVKGRFVRSGQGMIYK